MRDNRFEILPFRRLERVAPSERWLILSALAVAFAVAVVLVPVTAASAPDDLGPGCAPDRPAIAHHAGGVIVESPKGKAHAPAPIPCVTSTGWRTSEIALVVTDNGDLVFQPAFDANGTPLGAIHSADQGATWTFVQPSDPGNPPSFIGLDQNLAVDRAGGRVLWITPGYNVPPAFVQTSRLNASDDNGRTFFRASIAPLGQPDPSVTIGQVSRDHPQVFAGPPPANVRPLMRGYPDVVYVCQSNAPQLCGRSLDGGLTFGPPVGIPFPPECGGPFPPLPVDVPYNTNFGLTGVIDRHGTVYLPNTPCNLPYIAISHDAGDSWTLSKVADTLVLGYGMLSAGVDKEGNLYAGWIDISDRLPRLSISRDDGAHWSAPMMIGAPGVKETALPTLVAGERGHVAFTYYGSTNSPGAPFPPSCPTLVATSCPAWANVTWNTYITETFNALAQEPLFWSAPINNPDQPSWYGCTPSEIGVVKWVGSFGNPGIFTDGCHPASSGGFAQAGGRDDYFGMNMALDGTPWIGFAQACPNGNPVPENPNCDQAAGGPNDSLFGLVGRLVRSQGNGKH